MARFTVGNEEPDWAQESPQTDFSKVFRPPERLRSGRFYLLREPERCLYPGDLLRLLNEHKHPRILSFYVERNRWGDRARHAFGMPPTGTLKRVPNWEDPPNEVMNIPANCMPYVSIQQVTFNEKTNMCDTGEFAKGWRAIVHDLTVEGLLRASHRLSCIIGEDTRDLISKDYLL